VEEGIVAGGGVGAHPGRCCLFEGLGLEGDEANGANIVKVALEAPAHAIAVNTVSKVGLLRRRFAATARARAERRDR